MQDTTGSSHHWLTDSALFYQSLASAQSLTEEHAQYSLKNLYQGHELQIKNPKAVIVERPNEDWLFILIVGLFGALAYVRAFYNKHLTQILSAFLNRHLTLQSFRDENLSLQRTLQFLIVNFTLTASLILYLISNRVHWTFGIEEGIIRYFVIAGILLLAILLKAVLLKFCGFLFLQQKDISLYTFNISIINSVLGLALVPVAAIMLFTEVFDFSWLIYLSLLIGGAAYLYRLIRGLSIGLNHQNYSPFHLFLYLCALEIAPLLVIIKLIAIQQ